MARLEHLRQRVREVVRQPAHEIECKRRQLDSYAMQPVVIGDVMWEPSPEVISKSRLKRFMDQHGIATFAELLKRADEDIEWFCDAAIKDIDIAFYRHYDKVVDLSEGTPWARWWIDVEHWTQVGAAECSCRSASTRTTT